MKSKFAEKILLHETISRNRFCFASACILCFVKICETLLVNESATQVGTGNKSAMDWEQICHGLVYLIQRQLNTRGKTSCGGTSKKNMPTGFWRIFYAESPSPLLWHVYMLFLASYSKLICSKLELYGFLYMLNRTVQSSNRFMQNTKWWRLKLIKEHSAPLH